MRVAAATLAGARRAKGSLAASGNVAGDGSTATSSALSSWAHTSQDWPSCWATCSNWCAAKDSCNQPIENNASQKAPRRCFAFAKLLLFRCTSFQPDKICQNYRQILGPPQRPNVSANRRKRKGSHKEALYYLVDYLVAGAGWPSPLRASVMSAGPDRG